MMGDRDADTVESYSAQGPDYLKAHFRSFVYQGWSRNGNPDGSCFRASHRSRWRSPPPGHPCRWRGWVHAALAVAFDGSLGTNGALFPRLREHVPGYSGLRVPARFSMLVGLSLAILSGFGAARLIASRPAWAPVLTVAILAITMAEALPNITLERVWAAAARHLCGDRRRPRSGARRISDAGQQRCHLDRHAVSVFLDVPLAQDGQRQQRVLAALIPRDVEA